MAAVRKKTTKKKVAAGSLKKKTTRKTKPKLLTTETRVVYKPVPMSRIKARDAQAIGELLETNKNENEGTINIEQLVACKDDPASPAYSYFTHDPQKAAEKCWRTEAQYIIRSINSEIITVRVMDDGTEEVTDTVVVRAYPAIKESGDFAPASYRLITDVLTDKVHKKHLHLSLYKYLLAGYEKYCAHGELMNYLDEIKPLLYKLGKTVDFSRSEVNAKLTTILERTSSRIDN